VSDPGNAQDITIDFEGVDEDWRSGSNSYPAPCTGGAGSGSGIYVKDIWFKFIAPEGGAVFISRSSNDPFDAPKMSVYSSCEQSAPFICTEGVNLVIENLNPGQEYILDVWLDRTLNDPPTAWSGTFNIIGVVPFVPDCPAARITEVHYDNEGDDIQEFIEITGLAGESLAGYTVEVHPYDTTFIQYYDYVHVLDGNSTNVPNSDNTVDTILFPESIELFGFVVESYLTNSTAAISLRNPLGEIVDLISYEGSVVVDGFLSYDIGVQENSQDALNMSLRCQDLSNNSQWERSTPSSPNAYNVELPIISESSTAIWSGGNGSWFTNNWESASGYTSSNFRIFDKTIVTIPSGEVTVDDEYSNNQSCYSSSVSDNNETTIKSLVADGDMKINGFGSLIAEDFLTFNGDLDLESTITAPIISIANLEIGNTSIKSASIIGDVAINNALNIDIDGLAGSGVVGGNDFLEIQGDLDLNTPISFDLTGSYPMGTEISIISYANFDQVIDESLAPQDWIIEDDKSLNQIKLVKAQRPINDLCVGAISIPLSADAQNPTPISTTNEYSRQDEEDQCGGSSTSKGVWYSISVPEDATYSLSATNFSSNVKLQLFQGDCTSLNSLFCGESTFSYLLEASQTYYVLATTENSTFTSFDLTLVKYESLFADINPVGINIVEPTATLDVNGSVRISNDSTALPGVLRYRRNSFEGFDGVTWKSLDLSNDNLGNHKATINIDANGHTIKNLSSPVELNDAAIKSYVDAHQDGDASPTNEIQSLSLNGNNLSISGSSGSVTLPNASSPSWSEVTNKPSGFADNIDDVNDNDNEPDNERISDITLTNTTLNIEEGSTTESIDLSSIATQWEDLSNNEIHYSEGQIGIGVSTSINDRMHIRSAVGENALRVQVGTATKLRVYENGGISLGSNPSNIGANNVYVADTLGVGEISPQEKLHVNGGVWIEKNSSSGNPTLNLVETGTSEDFIRLYMENNSENRAVIAARPRTNTDDSQINFFLDGPGDVMIIKGNERVAINRNTPNYPLHVGDNTSNGNGAHVTEGGAWTNGSSREFKENFQTISSKDILTKLASLNILLWDYKDSEEGTHLGPIAEEFHEAFGLGDNDKYISTVDADGVALAAIKALYEENQEMKEKLKSQNELLINLVERISKLEEK